MLIVLEFTRYVKSAPTWDKQAAHVASLSILLSPGLFIIDHIHFQYNGFLYGILILSIVLARKQSTLLYSGILFAILICLKHIYLYLALAYFVYLGRFYCLDPKNVFRPRFCNIIKLGSCVVGIFAIAFGPFVQWGQLLQLKSRLFPFSRGLCHAYWAPNIWAMYSFMDRALIPCKYNCIQVFYDRSAYLDYSGSALGSLSEPGRSQQCHSWTCGRYLLCSSSGNH